jgi:proline iminopeptidase
VYVLAVLAFSIVACAPAEENVPVETTASVSNVAAASESTSGSVLVGGAELSYVIEGEGSPCLVVGSSIYYPRTFSEELRNHLRLVFVDLRHFAPSDGSLPVEQITLDTYADDIDRVREALGFDRVAVMGHSMHGMMALEYARRYPDHVTHVITIGSPPVGLMANAEASAAFFDAEASDERKQVLEQNVERLGADEYGRVSSLPDSDALVTLYVTNGPMYWYDATYDAEPLWRDMVTNMEVFYRVAGLLSSYDLAQGPGQVATPVFVGLGRYDYVVPYSLWEDEKSKLADLTIHLFEESGHTPQLEEPAKFDRVLLDWLGDH